MEYTLKPVSFNGHIEDSTFINIKWSDMKLSDCPYDTMSADEWKTYCARGFYFSEAPVYKVLPWHSIVKIERRAKQSGWKLILRTTNHSGICPSHLLDTWLQSTTWIFVLPPYQLMLRISYSESCNKSCNEVSRRDFYNYTECSVITELKQEYDGTFKIPPNWSVNGGFRDYKNIDYNILYHGTSRYVDESPVINNLMSQRYNKQFWNFWKQYLPLISTGVFENLLICSWANTSGIPGLQTKAQKILCYDMNLRYMRKLLHSEFPQYCKSIVNGLNYETLEPSHWNPEWYHHHDQNPAVRWANVVLQIFENGSWRPMGRYEPSNLLPDGVDFRLSPNVQKLLNEVWGFIRQQSAR